MFKKLLKYLLGLAIIFLIYYISIFLLNILKIKFPPAILGLILFTICLKFGIIKEIWVEDISKFLLKYMPLLFVPFIVGLIAYKDLLLKNWLIILLVVFITTTLVIVSVGLFVQYGLKILKIKKVRKLKND